MLKALLLSSSQPLSIKDIQSAFTRFHEQASALPLPGIEPGEVHAEPAAGEPPEVPEERPPPELTELYEEVPSLVTGTQIRETMDEIAREMKEADQGLVLLEGSAGFRLATHPRFARWVRILRQEAPPMKLSQSAVETLAVVAYRQPVTRSEIEAVRGVAAEAGLAKLLERELIMVAGRADLPGRPLQYSTTDRFLEFVGVKSLDELPASDVLTSRQIDEWLRTASAGHTPGDTDMGLDNELPFERTPASAVPAPTQVVSEPAPSP